MGMPFLLHEDHLDVSPTRSTFSFGSFSGLGDDRRALDRGGWQATIMGTKPDKPTCLASVQRLLKHELKPSIALFSRQVHPARKHGHGGRR